MIQFPKSFWHLKITSGEIPHFNRKGLKKYFLLAFLITSP